MIARMKNKTARRILTVISFPFVAVANLAGFLVYGIYGACMATADELMIYWRGVHEFEQVRDRSPY